MNALIGKILNNRYEVLRPLGEGGMGKVYIAKDKRFGKRVVKKETFRFDYKEKRNRKRKPLDFFYVNTKRCNQ